MLPPGSRFRHYWDYMMVVVVLYNCILTPMQVGFCNGPIFVDSATPLSVLDVLLWLLFVSDVFINFRTSYYDEDHQIVLSAKTVAKRYGTSWFLWDLFCTIPYHLIAAAVTAGMPGSTRVRTRAPACPPPRPLRPRAHVHPVHRPALLSRSEPGRR